MHGIESGPSTKVVVFSPSLITDLPSWGKETNLFIAGITIGILFRLTPQNLILVNIRLFNSEIELIQRFNSERIKRC